MIEINRRVAEQRSMSYRIEDKDAKNIQAIFDKIQKISKDNGINSLGISGLMKSTQILMGKS